MQSVNELINSTSRVSKAIESYFPIYFSPTILVKSPKNAKKRKNNANLPLSSAQPGLSGCSF
jgi:hypothetical protein